MKSFLARGSLLLLSAVVLSALPAYCADRYELGGHLKYQNSTAVFDEDSLNAAAGLEVVNTHELDARLNAKYRRRAWSAAAHAELLGIGGNAGSHSFEGFGAAAPSLRQASSLPDDDRRLFRLTSEIISEEHFDAVLRLDRAFVNYAPGDLAVRAGRQAVSWGNGLVFQALDPFNPFSPIEIDKDYKSGDDLLWIQWLFDSGEDLEALIVPRRDPKTDSVMNRESSYALKLRGRADALAVDYDVLGARHYDQWLLGAGLSRNVLEAVVRADVLLTAADNDHTELLLVANVDRTWVVWKTNIYTFVEYFRSDFGRDPEFYTVPHAELANRLARGELFTIGRDYAALGGFIEITPLQQTNVNAIFNLHDDSGILQLRHVYEAAQDISLMLGLNTAFGPRGSEFGGLLVSGTDAAVDFGTSAYIRISFFF